MTAESQSEYKLNKLYKYKKYALLRRLEELRFFRSSRSLVYSYKYLSYSEVIKKNKKTKMIQKHPYHIVTASPWPVLASIAATLITTVVYYICISISMEAGY